MYSRLYNSNIFHSLFSAAHCPVSPYVQIPSQVAISNLLASRDISSIVKTVCENSGTLERKMFLQKRFPPTGLYAAEPQK